MGQLVGTSCVVCGGRIGSVTDGRFCEACGRPIHTRCVRPTADDAQCAACGATAEQRAGEPTPPDRPEGHRVERTGGRAPRTLILGAVGCGLMTVNALWSTLDPRPNGRLLNTAPAIGFDIFLPIGLLGMGYCVFRLLGGR